MQHNVLNILNIGNGTCLVGQKCVYCLGTCLHGFQLQTGCKQQLSVYSLKKSHVHVASNFLKASGICRKVFLCEAACLTQHVNIQKDENQVHWACASWSTRGAACIAMVSLTALASFLIFPKLKAPGARILPASAHAVCMWSLQSHHYRQSAY